MSEREDPMDDGGGDRLTAYQRDDLTQHIDSRIKALSTAPDERQAGLREALEVTSGLLRSMTTADQRTEVGAFISAISQALDEAESALAVAQVPAQPDEERDVFDPAAEGYRLMVPAEERLDVERLARVLAVSPIAWTVRSESGAWVMTRMYDTAEEAAEYIAVEYRALGVEDQDEGGAVDDQ